MKNKFYTEGTVESLSREELIEAVHFHSYHHERLSKQLAAIRINFFFDGPLSDDLFVATMEVSKLEPAELQ